MTVLLSTVVCVVACLQKKPMLLLVPLVFLSFSAYTLAVEYHGEKAPAPFYNQAATFVARVTDAPQAGEEYTKAELEIVYVNGEKHRFLAMLTTKTALHYGDIVSFSGKLKQPKAALNDGDFDYSAYLRAQKIFATVYAENVTVHGSGADPKHPYTWAMRLRAAILQRIDRLYEGQRAALLGGILLGNKSNMTDETKDLLSESSLSHICAVSGLHLSIVTGLILLVLRRIQNVRLRSLAVMPFIVAFMLVTGLSPSVMRAGIMLLFYHGAYLFLREGDSLNALGLAVLVMLLANPLTACHTGFQMSALATLGILLFQRPLSLRLKWLRPAYLRELCATTAAAQSLLLPVVAVCFHRVPLLALCANLLVLPFMPLVLGLGFASVACAGFFAGPLLAKLCSLLLWGIELVMRLFTWLPFGSVEVYQYLLPLSVCFYALVSLAFIRPKWAKGLVAGGAALFLCVCVLATTAQRQALRLHLINVGQGESILLTRGSTAVLIDGGQTTFTGETTVDEVIYNYLRRQGVRRLDAVFLTHPDQDHTNGIMPLLQQGMADNLFLPAGHRFFEGEPPCPTTLLRAGQRVRVDDLSFEILWPDGSHAQPANAQSLVLLARYGGSSVLFTGDIGFDQEQALLARYPDLTCDILKIAHHGSKYSTSPQFLAAVAPSLAVISAGDASAHHPSDEVMERLAAQGVPALVTEYDGTILLTYRGGAWHDLR